SAATCSQLSPIPRAATSVAQRSGNLSAHDNRGYNLIKGHAGGQGRGLAHGHPPTVLIDGMEARGFACLTTKYLDPALTEQDFLTDARNFAHGLLNTRAVAPETLGNM